MPSALLDRVASWTLDGLLGATTLTTIHYLATKVVGARAARGHLRTLLGLFEVAPVTRVVLTEALDLSLPGYEDAVLHEAGRHAGTGFAKARLKVYAPDELLRFLAATPES